MSVPKKRPTVMQLARNKRGTRFFVQWQRGIGFITWQVTPNGESILGAMGITDGQTISTKLMADLKAKDHIYTRGAGATGPTQFEHASPPAHPTRSKPNTPTTGQEPQPALAWLNRPATGQTPQPAPAAPDTVPVGCTVAIVAALMMVILALIF